MIFKAITRATIAVASIAIVAISVVALTGTDTLKMPFKEEDVPLHSLTGVEGVDGPVVVVKIDDTTFAHPQVGLKDADVVYIEQVEGGLTRLAAVFSSTIPNLVGPIRSARISDIELLSQYGRVGFAYSGAQSKFLPVLAAANLADIGATHYGPTYYANDPLRRAPYAMMLKSEELLKDVLNSGKEIAQSKKMGWTFGDAPANLRAFKSVHIAWPASSYDAQWSKSENRWLLSHSGQADLDSDGYQLGPETIVIQMVSITNSIYRDKVGGITPFTATVGSGDCYILRNGGMVKAKWSRPDELSGTTFTTLSGEEISFDRGQIWFALTSKEPEFKGLSAQDATPALSK